MRFILSFLCLFAFLYGPASLAQQNLRLSEVKKIFIETGLNKYVVAGQSVMGFFDRVFKRVADPSVLDGGFGSEYFDLEYQVNLRPNIPEPYLTLDELTQDTNQLLRLHRKHYAMMKNKVFIRNYFQTAFIGLLHTIESIKRVQVGLPQDGYNVLTNLILEYGRLITGDQQTLVTMTDFWWDYIWAYFTAYPIDIVELGNQKLRGVWLSEKKDLYKKQIEKFLASYSMLALRKGTPPLIYRDVTNQLFLRLAKNAYEIYGLRDDAKALAKARIFKYKYETKLGLTEDAERTRREIAREGLGIRFRKIYAEPYNRIFEQEHTPLRRAWNAVVSLLYGIYSWTRYLVGFLLITFPFDGAFIVAGLIILSIEGRVQFNEEFWMIKKPSHLRKNKLNPAWKVFYALKGFCARVINDLIFSLQMLLHVYTQDSTTRNVRIGSSLLIFGLGLFFSSARTMVESFVAQMAI